MDEIGHSSGQRKGRRRRRVLLGALVVCWAIGGGVAHAWFTASRTVAGNAFTTGTLAPPSSLSLTSSVPVGLSWAASPSSYATGTRVYRSTSAGGTRSLVGTVTPRTTTTWSQTPGLGAYYYEVRSYFQNWESVASNQVARDSTTFVFKSTTGYTLSGGCYAASQRERDMEQGFTPSDPAETMTRTGGTGLITFCTDTMVAGETLAAGTTTISAWVVNTHGSTCQISAYLTRNDTVALGNGTITIPNNSPLALRTWSFPTTGFTAAAGDRIDLILSWQGVSACNSTVLHYDGAATPSRVTLPTITGV